MLQQGADLTRGADPASGAGQAVRKGWLVAIGLLLLAADVRAQTGALEGRVVDAQTEQPLPDVNVVVRGRG